MSGIFLSYALEPLFWSFQITWRKYWTEVRDRQIVMTFIWGIKPLFWNKDFVRLKCYRLNLDQGSAEVEDKLSKYVYSLHFWLKVDLTCIINTQDSDSRTFWRKWLLSGSRCLKKTSSFFIVEWFRAETWRFYWLMQFAGAAASYWLCLAACRLGATDPAHEELWGQKDVLHDFL